MSDEHTGGSHRDDDVFIADPSGFDDELLVERPGWPKPVGIIGLVLGILGLVCGGLGVAGSMLGKQFMQSAASNMQGGMPDVLLNPPQSLIAMQIFGTLWAIVLVVAAVTLLSRNPVARILHIVYVAVAIPMALWGVKMQIDMQLAVAEWINANPDADFSKQPGGLAGMYVGLFFGVVLGVGWPMFLLVWFGLVKRKPTDITGTAPEAAA